MARYQYSGTTAAALVNNDAIASIVPTASVGFKLRRVIVGIMNSVGAVTDTQVVVGINRATARGTSSGTATAFPMEDDLPASPITAVDNAWSAQPTLAAADVARVAFNTRGGADISFEGVEELKSTVGTANCIVLVNRSGGTLPTAHSIAWTIEIEV